MPKICEPCRVHLADNAVTECPECGQAMKLTFLPPPGQPADKLLLKDRPPRREVKSSTGGGDVFAFVGENMRWIRIGFLLVCILIGALLRLNSGGTFEQRLAKCHVGMPILEAMKHFDDDNRPARQHGAHRFTGTPDDGSLNAFDSPVDVMGDGWVEYDDGSDSVRIHFDNGRVTRLERK